MEYPYISPRFDVEDIRRLREYNSYRHANMTHEEIIADIQEGAAPGIKALENLKNGNLYK